MAVPAFSENELTAMQDGKYLLGKQPGDTITIIVKDAQVVFRRTEGLDIFMSITSPVSEKPNTIGPLNSPPTPALNERSESKGQGIDFPQNREKISQMKTDSIEIPAAIALDPRNGDPVGGTVTRYFHDNIRISGWEQLDNCNMELPCPLRHNNSGPSPCNAVLKAPITIEWQDGSGNERTTTVRTPHWCGKS